MLPLFIVGRIVKDFAVVLFDVDRPKMLYFDMASVWGLFLTRISFELKADSKGLIYQIMYLLPDLLEDNNFFRGK